MPRIRCPQCEQVYDVPPLTAMKLPTSIARCSCGEWLSGSRAALLARQIDPDDVQEIDMQLFRAGEDAPRPEPPPELDGEAFVFSGPRSIRVIARGADESIDTVFTIGEHPLYIGRKASHVEIDDAELSLRHFSITRRRADLILRDEDSHTGTFLDGEPVTEVTLTDGMHLIRAGNALISVEAVSEPGIPVEPLSLEPGRLWEPPEELAKVRPHVEGEEQKKFVLSCLEGPRKGEEFEIPDEGFVVGREGTLSVADSFLSRRHFQILFEPDGTLRVRDLGSRNGTFLNTLPAKNTRIRPGDEIRAGSNVFRIDARE